MVCDECIKGVLHEGPTRGSFVTLGGVKTYVVLPDGDYDPTKALLYLSDIFGFVSNGLLLADAFAANGIATYMPDYLGSDPIPVSMLNNTEAFERYRDAWRLKHSPAAMDPIIHSVLEGLRCQGVRKIAGTGYCYGGPPIVRLMKRQLLDVGIVAHPAAVPIEDFQAVFDLQKAPLLMNACEFDYSYPLDYQEKVQAMFGDGRYKPEFRQNCFMGCTHGFAVRGDPGVAQIREGKEGAFAETVKFCQRHL